MSNPPSLRETQDFHEPPVIEDQKPHSIPLEHPVPVFTVSSDRAVKNPRTWPKQPISILELLFRLKDLHFLSFSLPLR